MDSQGSVLVVGQPNTASRLESAIDSGDVVTRESTVDAVEHLQTKSQTECVVSSHDPPKIDCFQLLAESLSVPVIVAVTDGSSELATTVHQQGAATYIDLSTIDDAESVLSSAVDEARSQRPATGAAESGRASSAQLAADRDHVEEFISIISHELRTPVQKANSGLDLIAADCDSDYIDDVRETLERMEELLDELMSIVKYGDTVEETTAIDLDTIVTDSWPNAPNTTLSTELSLPTIEAEESRLRQIFENLFRNALEHGSGETEVRVGVIDHGEAGSASDTTGIYVADNGPGIPPEKRQQVFEYGYTGSEEGTGLGLAIVDRIVEAFGWDIVVTESRDGGARFEIRNISVA